MVMAEYVRATKTTTTTAIKKGNRTAYTHSHPSKILLFFLVLSEMRDNIISIKQWFDCNSDVSFFSFDCSPLILLCLVCFHIDICVIGTEAFCCIAVIRISQSSWINPLSHPRTTITTEIECEQSGYFTQIDWDFFCRMFFFFFLAFTKKRDHIS